MENQITTATVTTPAYRAERDTLTTERDALVAFILAEGMCSDEEWQQAAYRLAEVTDKIAVHDAHEGGPAMSTVYVVSFASADDQGGVSGFYWWPDLARAEQYYSEAVRESARDVREGHPGHIVRLVALDSGWGPYDADEITEIIGDDLGLIEVSHSALRQYVPPTTIPQYVPTGGLDRSTRKES